MTERLDAALAAIDAANAEDPRSVTWEGRAWPQEVLHAERMTHWLAELDPEADAAQRLAARAHHFRRWTRPRADYPEGRAGYLRWRTDARAAHAVDVGEVLAARGVAAALVDRVGAINRKEGPGRDPQVQTHEDALCLTFLELQAAEFLGARPPGERERIVTKTLAKMSDRAVDLARSRGLLD